MHGCWSWRWKLKERYKHKVKANVKQSRKAAAKHWTKKKVGEDFACSLSSKFHSYTLHLCMYLCRCLRAKHTMGCLQKLLRLKLNLSFYEGNNKYSIKVISLSKKLDFICAGPGRANQFTVQTSWEKNKRTIINEWHSPSFVFLS